LVQTAAEAAVENGISDLKRSQEEAIQCAIQQALANQQNDFLEKQSEAIQEALLKHAKNLEETQAKGAAVAADEAVKSGLAEYKTDIESLTAKVLGFQDNAIQHWYTRDEAAENNEGLVTFILDRIHGKSKRDVDAKLMSQIKHNCGDRCFVHTLESAAVLKSQRRLASSPEPALDGPSSFSLFLLLLPLLFLVFYLIRRFQAAPRQSTTCGSTKLSSITRQTAKARRATESAVYRIRKVPLNRAECMV